MLALLLFPGHTVRPARAALPRRPRDDDRAQYAWSLPVATLDIASTQGDGESLQIPTTPTAIDAEAQGAEEGQLSSQQPGILNCTDATRIMPLGDSITVGFSSGVPDVDVDKIIAYRKDLWDALKTWRYSINFVGSRRHGWAYEGTTLGFDPDHEGHGGWHAKGGSEGGIAPNVYNWLVANPADVVLLHIGTNDISANGQNADDVREILKEIDRINEDITVILALIINRNPYNLATTQFNNDVKNMALNRINQEGDKIIIIDMENGAGLIYAQQPQGDMWNDKHPYATGYNKMAAVWKKALVDLLPVCAVADSFTVNEDSPPALFDVLANDRGEYRELVEVGSTSQGGNARQDGSKVAYQPAPDFFGVETFTYKIKEGPPGSNRTSTVTMIVNPVNDPPDAVDDAFEIPEDSGALFDVLANDRIAPDANETLTIIEVSNGMAEAQIHINGGKISYTPAPDFFGIETFTYTINDGTPGSNATATVTVTVTPVEDPPRVSQPGAQMNAEGESVSLQIEASDPDGDVLTFRATGLPFGLSIDPATGSISGTLAYNSRGNHTVQVMVSDGKSGGEVTTEFRWQVTDRPNSLFLPIFARRASGVLPRP